MSRAPLVNGRRLAAGALVLAVAVPLALWPGVALWAVLALAAYCVVMSGAWWLSGAGADRRRAPTPPLAGRVPAPPPNLIYTTRDLPPDFRR